MVISFLIYSFFSISSSSEVSSVISLDIFVLLTIVLLTSSFSKYPCLIFSLGVLNLLTTLIILLTTCFHLVSNFMITNHLDSKDFII